ncbi:hypothetical protein ACFLQ2_01000 [archaeon]
MKRLLLALLVLSVAFAVDVDDATGCEKYSDHVICPQATDVALEITYTTDADCYSLQNEFGNLEDLGCYADAVTSGIEYEACGMYVPFDENDILISEIDYEHQCSTEKIAAGETIYVFGFQDQFTGCETIEEDEFYGEYLCPVNGQKRGVTGAIEYYEGDYGLLLYTQEEQAIAGGLEDIGIAVVVLGIIVLFIYALYIWSEREK